MRRRDRYEIKKLPNGNSETIDHAYASTISIDIDGKRKAFISSTARLTSWLIFSGNSMQYCRLLNTPDAPNKSLDASGGGANCKRVGTQGEAASIPPPP